MYAYKYIQMHTMYTECMPMTKAMQKICVKWTDTTSTLQYDIKDLHQVHRSDRHKWLLICDLEILSLTTSIIWSTDKLQHIASMFCLQTLSVINANSYVATCRHWEWQGTGREGRWQRLEQSLCVRWTSTTYDLHHHHHHRKYLITFEHSLHFLDWLVNVTELYLGIWDLFQ